MSSGKNLRTIHFSPVKLTLDDVYVIEKMLKDYFGECNIEAGWKKFAGPDELLGYLAKKSIKIFFMQQYCFRRIIFKSTDFSIRLLRLKTIIELPEEAIEDIYA